VSLQQLLRERVGENKVFAYICYQCCGSGMFIPDPGPRLPPIPDPGSRIPGPGSRIPDPKTATKETDEKKISCHTFLCSHKFHKIVNYFSFEVLKKKNLGQFSKDYRTFYQKNCKKPLKNMVLGSGIRDPRPGTRDPEKTYSGSRIPDPGAIKHPIPDPGSRTPDPDPQHCLLWTTFNCSLKM
jgi:hypothetical protein